MWRGWHVPIPRTFDPGDCRSPCSRGRLECLQDIAKVVENAGRSHKIDDATMIPTIFVATCKGSASISDHSEREH